MTTPNRLTADLTPQMVATALSEVRSALKRLPVEERWKVITQVMKELAQPTTRQSGAALLAPNGEPFMYLVPPNLMDSLREETVDPSANKTSNQAKVSGDRFFEIIGNSPDPATMASELQKLGSYD